MCRQNRLNGTSVCLGDCVFVCVDLTGYVRANTPTITRGKPQSWKTYFKKEKEGRRSMKPQYYQYILSVSSENKVQDVINVLCIGTCTCIPYEIYRQRKTWHKEIKTCTINMPPRTVPRSPDRRYMAGHGSVIDQIDARLWLPLHLYYL